MQKFKTLYIVCIDLQDDINYVVARNPSLRKARKIAKKVENEWPEHEVYISLEKIPVLNPLGQNNLANIGLEYEYSKSSYKNPLDRCICGAGYGECVGNLSCKCNPVAKCKNVTTNPYDSLSNFAFNSKQALTEVDINVLDVRRGVVEVVIPKWDPDESFGVSPNEIPIQIRENIESGITLVGNVNLTAESIEDLVIDDLRIKDVRVKKNKYLFNPDEDIELEEESEYIPALSEEETVEEIIEETVDDHQEVENQPEETSP